jgi:hypothetical protein
MRTVYERKIAEAAKIEGRISAGTDRFVQSLVGPVCRAIWPDKTDAHVAAICGCDPRNARRYMSGEIPLPSILLAAINVKLTQRGQS